MTKSLYIHIPFCNKICRFCDFNRFIARTEEKESYINHLISIVKSNSKKGQYKTIYIGGGTPNSLSDKLLNFLLSNLSNYLDNEYEFTIELNPEFVTEEQIKILIKNKVNRVSLGVQTLNDKILFEIGSAHTSKKVKETINLLKKWNIKNISCDFIYGFKGQNDDDIREVFAFIEKYKITHYSFYELETDNNSIFNKEGYQKDQDKIQDFAKLIDIESEKLGFIHYEVSNYAINQNYFSKHNLNYWNFEPWTAIGYGAYGFENNNYYHYDKRSFNVISEPWDDKMIYETIIQMALRMRSGLDLNKQHHFNAYQYYKDKIKDDLIIMDNHAFCKNINNLNQILLKLIK